MKKYSVFFLSIIAFLCFVLSATAQDLRLPDIFSDNMVLQQQKRVRFHGYSDVQHKIAVVPSWNGDTLRATTASNGEWSVELNTPDAGGPYTITVMDGDRAEVIDNVLIGEVWLASGQSNMEMNADWHPDYYKEDIEAAHNREIRVFKINKITAPYPQKEVRGQWKVLDPSSMRTFSLAAYYFGQRLNRELHRPVGLIQSAWGGNACGSLDPH